MSVRRLALALAAAALAIGAGTCVAQIPSSTENFRDRIDKRSFDQGRLILRHIGECLYRKDPGQARGLLTTAPGSYDEGRDVAGMKSRIEQCIAGGAEAILVSTPELRGALSEGMYRARYPDADPPLGQETAAAAALPPAWMAAYKKNPKLQTTLALHAFARCVAAADPGDVARLVRALPGSPEEGGAFRGLGPQLGPCLGKGEHFSADKPSLRALLAEALYDRAVATEMAGAGRS